MATKKKQLKTVILKAPKVAHFNLTLEDKNENARIVLSLESLRQNAGWLFLTQVFEENKKVLAQMIIEKTDIDGKPITEAQADEARYKHAYLKELMEKPDFYLKKLKPHADPIDENDPYDQGKDK